MRSVLRSTPCSSSLWCLEIVPHGKVQYLKIVADSYFLLLQNPLCPLPQLDLNFLDDVAVSFFTQTFPFPTKNFIRSNLNIHVINQDFAMIKVKCLRFSVAWSNPSFLHFDLLHDQNFLCYTDEYTSYDKQETATFVPGKSRATAKTG